MARSTPWCFINQFSPCPAGPPAHSRDTLGFVLLRCSFKCCWPRPQVVGLPFHSRYVFRIRNSQRNTPGHTCFPLSFLLRRPLPITSPRGPETGGPETGCPEGFQLSTACQSTTKGLGGRKDAAGHPPSTVHLYLRIHFFKEGKLKLPLKRLIQYF